MPLARAQNPIFELDPVLLFFSLEPLPFGQRPKLKPALAKDFTKLRFSETEPSFQGLNKSSRHLLSSLRLQLSPRETAEAREQCGAGLQGGKTASWWRWGGWEAVRWREAWVFIN